jgi:hypothetical protein
LQSKRFCGKYYGVAGESVEPIQLFALVSKAIETGKVRKFAIAINRFFRFTQKTVKSIGRSISFFLVACGWINPDSPPVGGL